MTETQRATDTQIGGDHYRSMAIQPSEFIQRNGLNWCEGNVIKYLARHRNKNGAQDILKAIHYCQLLLEWEYPGHGKTAADYTPLSPSEVKEIVESVAPVSLCASCTVERCGDASDDMAQCASFKAPPSDEWETKDLCRRCGNTALYCTQGENRQMAHCRDYVPKPEAPAPLSLSLSLSSAKFSYNFPAAEKFMGEQTEIYISKLHEEVNEVYDARTVKDTVIELMDVIHVAETAIRTLAANHGLDVEELAEATYQKNLDRGYYTR